MRYLFGPPEERERFVLDDATGALQRRRLRGSDSSLERVRMDPTAFSLLALFASVGKNHLLSSEKGNSGFRVAVRACGG
jgi:hypothetical protein